jgi:hypothetical protein
MPREVSAQVLDSDQLLQAFCAKTNHSFPASRRLMVGVSPRAARMWSTTVSSSLTAASSTSFSAEAEGEFEW